MLSPIPADPISKKVFSISELIDSINDPSVTHIKSDIRIIDKDIRINRSNLTLDLTNSIIRPSVDSLYPLQISSTIDTIERHSYGTITDSTNYLTSSSVSEFSVGQTHYLKLGVNFSDPNEAYTSIFRKVIAINGNTIVYDKPFGVTPRVFSSYEELIAASKMPEKVGPWGPVPGTYKRGLGQDHGIRIVTRPVENVTVVNPTVQWPAGSKLYGSNALMFSFAQNCRMINSTILNSCGSAGHFRWAEDCHFDGMRIRGDGRLNPWNQTSRVAEMTSPALSFWGGNIGCTASNLDIDGWNHALIVSEAGGRQITVSDVILRSKYTNSSAVRKAVIFGLYGTTDVKFENITLNIPKGIPLYPAGIKGIKVSNLRFETDELPDWIHWGDSFDIKHQLFWGTNEFLPASDVEISFIADKDGFQIPYPEGVILSATIVLESRNGIRNITCPSEVFTNNPNLELPIYQTAFQSKPGATYESYRAGLTHRIWIESGAKVPIKVRCKIMRKR